MPDDRGTKSSFLALSDLLFELKKSLDHFHFLFKLHVGFSLVSPLVSGGVFHELTFGFGNHVTDFFGVRQPERLAEKNIVAELSHGLSSLFIVATNYEGLTAHFDVLLCVDLADVNTYV